MVAKVFVTVFDEQNKIIEMGDAVHKEGDWWEFAARTEGTKIRPEPGTWQGITPIWLCSCRPEPFPK